MKLNSILIFLALIIVSKSCNGQEKNEKNFKPKKDKTELLNLKDNPSFEKQISLLKKSMIEYMETADPSYSKNDVEECEKILNNYLSDMSNSKSKDEGMKIVKNTVEKLNQLNEKCNFELIETSEREQIVDVIILASSKKGYNRLEDDITENWRKW